MDISTFDLTSLVTIVLQITGAEMTLHKQVLCTHCEVAAACLDRGFVEVGAGRILMKEEGDEESLWTLIVYMDYGKAMLSTIPITK